MRKHSAAHRLLHQVTAPTVCGENVPPPFSKVKCTLELQGFSGVLQDYLVGTLCESGIGRKHPSGTCCRSISDPFQTIRHRFKLWLVGLADTLRKTGRKGVVRIVNRPNGERSVQRWETNDPDLMPGSRREDRTQLTIVSCQTSIVDFVVHPPGLEPGTH